MDRVNSTQSLRDLELVLSNAFNENNLDGKTMTCRHLLELISSSGLALDDKRIACETQKLLHDPDRFLGLREMLALMQRNSLLETVLAKKLVISDFQSACAKLDGCFDMTIQEMNGEQGHVSAKTPKLARSKGNKIGAAFCTIDGQRWGRGSYRDKFVIQEASAPLVYCTALDLNGVDKVHQYVGLEPSGRPNRDLALDPSDRAYNPFVDTGMITCAALVQNEMDLADRFNYMKSVWAKAIGGSPIQFGNSHYLAQRKHASEEFCMAYLLDAKRAFPEGIDIVTTLNFHIMNCAFEMSCEELATFAATLASGGVCPITNERVFQAEHVQNCLSMMATCGANVMSIQFDIGFPIKTSTSGFTIVVVPNLGGYCTYSPKLDTFENSVFGMKFSENFVNQFNLHSFDSFVVQDAAAFNALFHDTNTKHQDETDEGQVIEPRANCTTEQDELFYCAARGETEFIRRLYARGVSIMIPDYDMRTPLHVAASQGHLECVKLLCMLGADTSAEDRMGNTPLKDAIDEGHDDVAQYLNHLTKNGTNKQRETNQALYHVGEKLEHNGSGSDDNQSQKEEGSEPEATLEKTVSFEPDEGTNSFSSEHGKNKQLERNGSSNYGPSRSTMSAGLHAYRMMVDVYANRATLDDSEDEGGSEGGLASSPFTDMLLRGIDQTDAQPPTPPSAGRNMITSETVTRWLQSLSTPAGEDGTICDPPTIASFISMLEKSGVRTNDRNNKIATLIARSRRHDSNASTSSTHSSSPSSYMGRVLSRNNSKWMDHANQPLSASLLTRIAMECAFVPKILEGTCVIPNFPSFCETLKSIYNVVMENRSGDVARYIPQLAKVNPEQFGIAVCSVDAQRFSHGDAEVPFCVQSCMKPISYCIALQLLGEEIVHRHVAHEPSGRNFNELTVNRDGLPHNPMINAGAIMCSSLILPEVSCSDRFDFVTEIWKNLAGGVAPGYSNETFLSEFATADRNFCLGYLMKEKHAFPKHVDSSQALTEVLEFYFQMCSLEQTCETLSVVAATLANGGINPITRKRVFKSETVRNCLSLCASCGMYDFSGEFQFKIGFPSKSGVSGALMIIIPNVMGLCTWSPRLDNLGNSARGIQFCQLLQDRYCLHRYSLLRGVSVKLDVRDYSESIYYERRCQRLIEAATRGDIPRLKAAISEGWCLNCCDYDGRTPMHLAASEGHQNFVKMLVENGADLSPVDRWGGTPLSESINQSYDRVTTFLREQGAQTVTNTGNRQPVKSHCKHLYQ